MANTSWHLRHIRVLIYAALAITIISIAASAYFETSDAVQVWVSAREYFGLAALALLMAAMFAGPLSFVLPWLPLRPHLMLGRRALGVSAFVLACLHSVAYLGPTFYWDWHVLYTPGTSWVIGLVLGVALFLTMGALAVTSRDQAVRRMGPRRWKRLHQSVYLLLPLVLIHAVFLGADFGVNHGPDVKVEADVGCLVSTLIAAAAWLVLFILRKRHVRWTPRKSAA